MFVAEEDLILFGKLLKKGEQFNNIFFGRVFKKEEIVKKLKDKGYKFREIVEDKKKGKDE